jgi:His/Glu/Gln/Arg/opine family amino acid ABC transporter permease subunit
MAATVLGVLIGVLRLSKNWIVARLMTFYVEIFRNVPLLLWILLIYTVFTEATPAPNAYRPNAEGVAAMSMQFTRYVAITNRYTAIPDPQFDRQPWLYRPWHLHDQRQCAGDLRRAGRQLVRQPLAAAPRHADPGSHRRAPGDLVAVAPDLGRAACSAEIRAGVPLCLSHAAGLQLHRRHQRARTRSWRCGSR